MGWRRGFGAVWRLAAVAHMSAVVACKCCGCPAMFRLQPLQSAVQGTACICLAGVLSALRATGRGIEEQRILFYGAGEAGTGGRKL